MTAVITMPRLERDEDRRTPDDADRQAFASEALPHLDQLFGYAIGLVANQAEAEDLVQETMLKAYRGWHRFRRGTNSRAWLFTILRNTFITQYHKSAARALLSP